MLHSNWKQPYHKARRFAAKIWLKLFPWVGVVGVTGSYGKTSTSRAIKFVLGEKAPVLQTDINLDTVFNIPITLLKLRPKHQFLVLEMGVDHQGEMDSYLQIVHPNIAVITGITPVHSETELLGSIEGIMEEKGKLLKNLPLNGWAILNKDNEYVVKMAKLTKAKILWYSRSEKTDFWASNIKVDESGTSFEINSEKFENKLQIKLQLIGEHFVESALAACCVGWIYGMSLEQIKVGLEKITPLSGRLNLSKGPMETVLLDDHLRANPASVKAGLETLDKIPAYGRKIAILGEMGELGKYKEEEHKKIGKTLGQLKIDVLISVGPLQKLTAEEAIKAGLKKENVYYVEDVFKAAEILKNIIKKGDLLYLKGSLLKHMERIIFLLEGKTVDCYDISCHRYQGCGTCSNLKR